MPRRPDPDHEHAGDLDATGSRRSSWLLVAVAGGVFIAADDQTSVVTVLPALIPDIGLAVDDFFLASWIINGYLLGYIVALPIVGRIADARGHGRVYAASLGVFMLGSALVAAAPDFWFLVVARGLQAVGGGAVVPVAMAIVVGQMPRERRALGLGAIAAASEAGALVGPLWGGLITELLGWRWMFWLNIPMSLPVLGGVWWLARNERAQGRIDWPGAALLAAGLAALTIAIADDPIAPRHWAITASLIAAAAALAVAFALRQRGLEEPMARLAMFAPKPVWSSAVMSVLVGAGLITVLISVPLFVNLVLVERPIDGGVTLLRFTAAVPVGALAGGWVTGRIGPRLPAAVGVLLGAICFAGLLPWEESLSQVWRTTPLVVGGLGFGLLIAPLGVAVLSHVRDDERAVAASWLTLARMGGMLVGTGLLTSHGLGRFYARAGAIEFDSPEFAALVTEAQVSTFHEIWIVAALVLALTAGLSWWLGGERVGEWWAAR
ncbi:MAG: MFS transporter [Chloroflexi bacterium]|nr:MFS transporter [Chloroflexota bacterium]